jgi:hypothetical protein
MSLRKTTIGSKEIYPYVTTWKGPNTNESSGLKSSAILKSFVTAQIGTQMAALFEDDFVNYNQGYILCQNIPDDLFRFFASTSPDASTISFRKTITFTSVIMPSTFKGQKGNLSKNYEYGERLRVSVSYESQPSESTKKIITQVPVINGKSVQVSQGPKNNGAGTVYLIYRDTNMSARTLKSQSNGGGGVGVWS